MWITLDHAVLDVAIPAGTKLSLTRRIGAGNPEGVLRGLDRSVRLLIVATEIRDRKEKGYMGNTAATHDEFLEHIRQALVGAGGSDQIVRWETLLSRSGDVGSLPSQIARDLGVPEAYVLSGVLDLAAWGTIRLGPAGLDCEERGLRIQPEDGRAVRFALLPHLKPIVVPEGDGLFSVALLALEYLNADPATGNYLKLADGSYPPVGWRVGYVILSLSELRQLSALPEDCSYQSLYGYDWVMRARGTPHEAEIWVKNIKLPAWKRHPEVAKKVEEAAQRLAQNGGAKLLETLGRHAALARISQRVSRNSKCFRYKQLRISPSPES